jgi:hypothetical protein
VARRHKDLSAEGMQTLHPTVVGNILAGRGDDPLDKAGKQGVESTVQRIALSDARYYRRRESHSLALEIRRTQALVARSLLLLLVGA